MANKVHFPVKSMAMSGARLREKLLRDTNQKIIMSAPVVKAEPKVEASQESDDDLSVEMKDVEPTPTSSVGGRLSRPSRNPKLFPSKTRKPFKTHSLTRVNSEWRPPLKPSRHNDKVNAALRSKLTKTLPKNVCPVVIRTKYPAYKMSNEELHNGCNSERDHEFLNLIAKYGRLLPSDRWKEWTLMEGGNYQHDLGLFSALDLALIAFIVNFNHDIKSLLGSNGRKKIRSVDIEYLMNHIWTRRALAHSKIIYHDRVLGQ
jgi:hypothetical protein